MRTQFISIFILCIASGALLGVKPDERKKPKVVSELDALNKSNKKTLTLQSFKDTGEGAIEKCAILVGDYSRCRKHIERIRKRKIEADVAVMAKEYEIICKHSEKLCRRLKRQVSEKLNCPTCQCDSYCQLKKDCIADCPILSALYQDHCASRCIPCKQRIEECIQKHLGNKEVCDLRCPICEKCKSAIYHDREGCKRICNEKGRMMRLTHRVKNEEELMKSLCSKCMDDAECQPSRDCHFCRECDSFTNKLARTAKNMLLEQVKQQASFCLQDCQRCGSLSLKTGKIVECSKTCFTECKGTRLNPAVVQKFAKESEEKLGLKGLIIDPRIKLYTNINMKDFEKLSALDTEDHDSH